MNPIGNQPFTQRLDDRNSARDARFVVDVDTGGLGGGEDLLAVECEQRLVGGDHRLARPDGVEDEFFRNRRAADQFDDDVRFANRLGGVGGEDPFRNPHAAVGGDIEIGDFGEDEFHTGAAGDHIAVGEDVGGDTGADGSKSDDSDFDLFHGHFPCDYLESIVKTVLKKII